MDALEVSQASLVGHDISGPIALLAASRHPDRVDRLAILNTTPTSSVPWLVRLLVAVAKVPIARRTLTTRAGFQALFRIGTANPDTKVRELVDRHREPVSKSPAGRRALRHVLANLDSNDLSEVEERIGELTCPTLILWGEDDASAPPAIAHRLHEQLPNSTLETLAHCGHFAPEDTPDLVTGHLLRFLTEVRNPPLEHRG